MRGIRALANDCGTLRLDGAESGCAMWAITRRRDRCHGSKRLSRLRRVAQAKCAAFAVRAEAHFATLRPLSKEGRDGRIARVVVDSVRRRERGTVVCLVPRFRGFVSWLLGVARLLALRAVFMPVIAFTPAARLPLIAPSLAFARALRVGSRDEG
eukprot:309349-Pleurochrysis_carterae.AAC.1